MPMRCFPVSMDRFKELARAARKFLLFQKQSSPFRGPMGVGPCRKENDSRSFPNAVKRVTKDKRKAGEGTSEPFTSAVERNDWRKEGREPWYKTLILSGRILVNCFGKLTQFEKKCDQPLFEKVVNTTPSAEDVRTTIRSMVILQSFLGTLKITIPSLKEG